MFFSGSPHVHCLLWLEDNDGVSAPTFWQEGDDGDHGDDRYELLDVRKMNIEEFADQITTTDPTAIKCDEHEDDDGSSEECEACTKVQEMVGKFQTHSHTFSCHKKNKFTNVNPDEGHGKDDKKMYGKDLRNIKVCRHNFPKYPMESTKFLLAPSKDLDENELIKRKADLKKIKKYLLRQTYSETSLDQSESWKSMKKQSFLQFLFEVGMFQVLKPLANYTTVEIEEAIQRYHNALGCSLKGTGGVFLKRKVENIWINAYNPMLLKLHGANHDIQIVVDQYAVAQYICGYLTKNESGISKLLKTISENFQGKHYDKLKAFASALDKGREVSVQEAVYRIRGDPMTKSSVKVKHISTAHPHYREGLLKANLETLREGEKVFHTSQHEYYESRPLDTEEPEEDPNYWENLCCADFISHYEIVYGKARQVNRESLIELQNNKGFIRKRRSPACLRYYLNFDNDEDLCRALLILFLPFRNEMAEIHEKDVFKLLDENRTTVEENRDKYEKFKLMTDLINEIQKQNENEKNKEDSESEDDENIETTAPEDVEDFEKWALTEATKELERLADTTDIPNVVELRKSISSLNKQQRRCFDDFTERIASTDIDEPPFYLWISGSAGRIFNRVNLLYIVFI